MLGLSAAAEAAVIALAAHFATLGRDRAIERLAEALETACARYQSKRGLFYEAPRPYPALASLGFRWTKQGAYWIAFDEGSGEPVVAAIFHDTADTPNRAPT